MKIGITPGAMELVEGCMDFVNICVDIAEAARKEDRALLHFIHFDVNGDERCICVSSIAGLLSVTTEAEGKIFERDLESVLSNRN